MTAQVNQRSTTDQVSAFNTKLLDDNKWKSHYYFGKFGQKNRSSFEMDFTPK